MDQVSGDDLGKRLLDIQKLDTLIDGLRSDIDALPEKHGLQELEAEQSEAGAGLAEKEKELEELKHVQLKLDGELDLLSTKIKKEEEKLFSGSVMNPKELQAIQNEIISLRKKRDEMETEDLEEMEAIDGLRDGIDAARATLEDSRRREAVARSSYEAELEEKRREVQVLQEERDSLKAGVDTETLETYDRMRSEKAGLAVVRIEQGRSCGGCHIEFSRSQIDTFQHEEGYFRCGYCRRILVK